VLTIDTAVFENQKRVLSQSVYNKWDSVGTNDSDIKDQQLMFTC